MYGLKEITIKKIKDTITQNPKVTEIIIYGSRAKGNYRDGSDIDITLKGNNLTLAELFILEESLDHLMLPYKIDLSLYDHIQNSNLLEHIDIIGKKLGI